MSLQMPYKSIRDDTYPFLVFVDNTVPASWNTGPLFSMLLESTFVRINSRGVQHSQLEFNLLHPGKWQQAKCTPDAHSFCRYVTDKTDGSTNMLMFPNNVVDIPDDFEVLTANGHNFLKHWNNTSPCTYKHSNRVLNVADRMYEVSLCDLFDGDLDMVLHDNTLYWNYKESSSLALYITYSILAIYIISLLTTNIVNILTKPQDNTQENVDVNTKHNSTNSKALNFVLYIVFLFGTLLFLTVLVIQERHICTRQDDVLRTLLLCYAGVQFVNHYIVQNLTNWSSVSGLLFKKHDYTPIPESNDESDSNDNKQDRPKAFQMKEMRDKSFSLLIAYMLLLIFLVYKTFDTPYLTLLTTLFLMRSWQKFFELAQLRDQIFNYACTLLDFFVVVYLLTVVFTTTKSHDITASIVVGQLHLFVLVFTSLMLALSMQMVKSK